MSGELLDRSGPVGWLRGQVRVADGRCVEPSGGIDSQSVRTADTVPAGTRGLDAGKEVKGRKRFIVADALGLLLAVYVVAATCRTATARGSRCFELGWTVRECRRSGPTRVSPAAL